MSFKMAYNGSGLGAVLWRPGDDRSLVKLQNKPDIRIEPPQHCAKPYDGRQWHKGTDYRMSCPDPMDRIKNDLAFAG